MIDGVTKSEILHRLALLESGGSSVSTPVGAEMEYFGVNDPSGWIIENGRTIGSSGAGLNGDTYRALYDHLWDMVKNESANLTTSSALTTDAATDWAALINIKTPDGQGISKAGLGTQVKNGRTKTGPTNLGDVQEDQGQGHRHGHGNSSDGAYNWGRFSAQGTTDGLTTDDPVTDGVNGTPRTGTETIETRMGTNYIIKL